MRKSATFSDYTISITDEDRGLLNKAQFFYHGAVQSLRTIPGMIEQENHATIIAAACLILILMYGRCRSTEDKTKMTMINSIFNDLNNEEEMIKKQISRRRSRVRLEETF